MSNRYGQEYISFYDRFEQMSIPFNHTAQFIITILNPLKHGYTDSKITDILTHKMCDVKYAFWNYYTKKNGTTVTDIYVYCPSNKSISKTITYFPYGVIRGAVKYHAHNIFRIKNPTLLWRAYEKISDVQTQEYGSL